MRRIIPGLLICSLACFTLLLAQAASPKIVSVTPETGKANTEFAIAGENLDKGHVAELYITDGKNDVKTVVIAQAAASIKFKTPASVKPGRYGLMILTADRQKFLEQPVKVTIE